MERIKLIISSIALVILCSCSSEEEDPRDVVIPSQFSVDIPASISDGLATSLNGREAPEGDGFIEGEDIYEALRYYIYLGEQSAEILEFTLVVGAALEQQNIRSFTFTGDDDQREKRIDLRENVTREGVNYAYEMVMADTENDERALQLLWNTDPVSGVAILNPYHLDRTDDEAAEDTYFEIRYTEGDPAYDATMTISLAGLEVEEEGDINAMKMFAGRKGDIVEVRGNSNHPDLTLVDPDFSGGRNYAFVGRGDESTGLGVVNLWLPASDVSTNQFEQGDEYSVFDILEDEIEAVAELDQQTINSILAEANSPAYFNENGFITSGEDQKPVSFDAEFVDLAGMYPFTPKEIRDLELGFID